MTTNRQRPRDLSDCWVWFDAEFTTLEFERAWLLQIAIAITDSSLRRLGPPPGQERMTIRLPPRAVVSPWVREQLAPLVRASRSPAAVPVAEADRRLAALVRRTLGPIPADIERRPVLAGNSVHADWWMIRKHLPRFHACLHYRHLDVTAFKLEWRRRCPAFDFEKTSAAMIRRYLPRSWSLAGERHDAWFDVLASMAELAFYRRHLLRAAPRRPPSAGIKAEDTP